MKALDLQSLNNEQIQELGLSRHDLWIVKLGDEIFGPFEAASLKDYAAENEELFDNASASRLDAQDWHPFFSYALFQRRNPQVVNQKNSDGPFWIMDLGLKVGPITGRELEKRIEMGTIGLTDIVSTDDGHSWLKIYQLSAFDRRFHSGQELPEAPLESDLQDVRLELIDRIENGEGSSAPSMALAELTREAQEAKVIPLRLDEIPLQTKQEVPVSSSLRWFVPGAAVAVFGLIVTFNFLSSEETTLTADVPVVEKTRAITRSARPAMPQPRVEPKPVVRAPASIPQYRPPQPRAIDNAYARESRYPTRVETHNNNDRYPSHDERDVEMDNYSEAYYDERDEGQPQPAKEARREHSLLDPAPAHQTEDVSLDAAMAGDYNPPDNYGAEEVSDF